MRRIDVIPATRRQGLSGRSTPASGQYQVVGPGGRKPGGNFGPEVTAVQGKALLPTPKPPQRHQLVDPTKH